MDATRSFQGAGPPWSFEDDGQRTSGSWPVISRKASTPRNRVPARLHRMRVRPDYVID